MSFLSSDSPIIGVVSLVMHNQLVINEVEAVRSCLKWVLNHQIDRCLVKLRKFIDMFASVFAVRYAEAKVEIESFQMLVSEEVPFYHPKVLDWSASDAELDCGTNRSELQKLK